MECNIPTFDVNTGILASKKAKTSSSKLSLPHRKSITSLNKPVDMETTANVQKEKILKLGLIKQERIEIEERTQETQHSTQMSLVYQPTSACNNENIHYYNNHEQYSQQYYNYNQADQYYNPNYAFNSNTNTYLNENNPNNNNSQLYYQHYYNQAPQYNYQVQTNYFNTEYIQNEQQKFGYNCEPNLNQESKAPLVIDESPSTYVGEEVQLAEQVEKTLTSTASSSENALPSFNTFLN